jgi:predicted nucleotidyltransferase
MLCYLSSMRITAAERTYIKNVFLELDPEALVYLFGSRADDSKKGGDIDLLVLSNKITENERRKIKLRLYDGLGEQKIDLIIAEDTSLPFVRIALESGVLL